MNVQRKIDWYNQLFLLGKGEKKKHQPTTAAAPAPRNTDSPFLYFFGSFAVLLATQEYTHQRSPGGSS